MAGNPGFTPKPNGNRTSFAHKSNGFKCPSSTCQFHCSTADFVCHKHSCINIKSRFVFSIFLYCQKRNPRFEEKYSKSAMAKPSKARESSDDALSNGSSSSEEEQINDQINEDDEEELEAVARSADADSDDDNSPASEDEAAADGDDVEEVSLRFCPRAVSVGFC